MKLLIFTLVGLILLPGLTHARPREVFKIEIGSNYEGYSKRELRRRVWELERAVYQLQEQVFHLSMNNQKGQSQLEASWTCSIQSMGKTFTATKATKGAARAEVLKDCSNHTNAIHCDHSDVKCEN